MKRYEELTLRDHFIFGKVCSKIENCQLILRALISEDIQLTNSDIEKYLKEYSSGKYIRLDLLAKDDCNTIYNAELQHKSINEERQLELLSRARYYHSILDSSYITTGMHYINMPNIYVIFICTFDPFGLGLAKYTFRSSCLETAIDDYDDGSTTIFFNTTADLSNLPQSTRNMLEYIQTGITSDSATNALDAEVNEARLKEEWRDEYMLTLVHDNDVYLEGFDNAIFSLFQKGKISKNDALEELGVDEATFDRILASSSLENPYKL